MKKYFWIYKIVIFCILAGFGLVSLIRPQNAFSDNENRSLEQYPEWKLQGVLDGSFNTTLTMHLVISLPAGILGWDFLHL